MTSIASIVPEQLERLRAIFNVNGFQMPLAEPASSIQIATVEGETEITFDAAVREFYGITNGSTNTAWLVVHTDEPTLCTLPTLEQCLAWWREWLPYDAGVQEQWGPTEDGRDARIRSEYFVHKRWFPIAESNGWGTTVFFDADPTDEGTYGQIIVYQHDPDAVYFVANSFSDLLTLSNDLMERNATDHLFLDGRPAMWAPPRL